MFHIKARFFMGLFFTLALSLGAGAAEDNRDFFPKPESPEDYWRRIKFEIEVGKFDYAGRFLKGFLEALGKLKPEEATKTLVAIEEKDGMSSFLRLKQLPELLGDVEDRQARLIKDKKARDAALVKAKKARLDFRADVDKLIDRATLAVNTFLRDPQRIRKFIKNLSASREERAWAINQLQRSKEAVVPYLLQELQANQGKIAHGKIYSAMLHLGEDIVPPLLAALDAKDHVVRRDIIDLMRDRGETRAIPHLWYLAGSDKYPKAVRSSALQALAELQQLRPQQLPAPKVALTKLADRYYRHEIKFPDNKAVTVWKYDEKKNELVSSTMPAGEAEEYYGLRYARQALDLDPAYKPAQVAFLSLVLDRGYGNDIHLPLAKKAPAVKELMATLSPDLIAKMLDRALKEHRLPVILGAVQTLGELGDVRSSKLALGGGPVLAKALNYPDRRVQMAAADAMLRIPGDPHPSAALRIVQILRRIILGDPQPRILVAYFDEEKAAQVAKLVKEAGYDPVIVRSRKAALHRLKEAADIDAILIDHKFPNWEREFPFVLADMRADVNYGLLPIIITAPDPRARQLRSLVEHYRNVWIEPENLLLRPTQLKTILRERIREASGRPLTDAEREIFALTSLDLLAQMSRGELANYDVRAAEDAIFKALRSPQVKLSLPAIEIVGKLSGPTAQRELAAIVLDPTRDKLRTPAAYQLSRHIQQNGLSLDSTHVKRIKDLYAAEKKDPKLKENLGLVISSMRPNNVLTGKRLKDFQLPPPKEKAKEGEKEKNGDKEKEKEKERKKEKEKENGKGDE